MSRKLCCLTLLAFTFAGYSIPRILHLSNPSTPILKADGGDPVPPWPKLRISHLSNPSTPILKADGGDPVPPWPKLRISQLSNQSTPILKADGGDPVPPWPKPCQLAA